MYLRIHESSLAMRYSLGKSMEVRKYVEYWEQTVKQRGGHGGLGEAGEVGGGQGGRFSHMCASVFSFLCSSVCEPYHVLCLVQGLVTAGP